MTTITFSTDKALKDYFEEEPDNKSLSDVVGITLLSSSGYNIRIGNFRNLETFIVWKGSWKLLNKLVQTQNKLTTLIITNCEIENIYKGINALSNLETLVLNNNYITSIPSTIYSLLNLRSLSLDDNGIQLISSKISNLNNLEYLSIKNNALSKIPESIWSLDKLEYIDLSCNKFTEITMRKTKGQFCQRLKTLKLVGNRLTELPANIVLAKQLTTLNLDNNLLTNDVMKLLYRLINLQVLSITTNKLTSFKLPTSTFFNMKELALSGNNLNNLDFRIFMLPHLKRLYVSNIKKINDNLQDYNYMCLDKGIKMICGELSSEIKNEI